MRACWRRLQCFLKGHVVLVTPAIGGSVPLSFITNLNPHCRRASGSVHPCARCSALFFRPMANDEFILAMERLAEQQAAAQQAAAQLPPHTHEHLRERGEL